MKAEFHVLKLFFVQFSGPFFDFETNYFPSEVINGYCSSYCINFSVPVPTVFVGTGFVSVL